jgi:hypothetical protein
MTIERGIFCLITTLSFCKTRSDQISCLYHSTIQSNKQIMDKSDQDWIDLVSKIEEELSKQSASSFQADLTELRSDPTTVAKYIDHTLLKTDATGDQIDQLCEEAITYGFAVRISVQTQTY